MKDYMNSWDYHFKCNSQNSNARNNPVNFIGLHMHNNNNFNVNLRFYSNASSFQLNKHPQYNPYTGSMVLQPQQGSLSPKRRFKKESFHYIDILINAADKIIKQGYCLIENMCDSNNMEYSDEMKQDKADCDKEDCVMEDSKNKILVDPEEKVPTNNESNVCGFPNKIQIRVAVIRILFRIVVIILV